MHETLGAEFIYRLARDPVHLWQLNSDPNRYSNPMGCGAFSTAMALSVYQPGAFANDGGYAIAKTIYEGMLKVPLSQGTFESQNCLTLRKYGLQAGIFLFGTFDQLTAAIDLGAPVILLVNRIWLIFGQHDVLMVGYSRDAQGRPLNLFVDNPSIQTRTQDAPAGLNYPGNEKIPVANLAAKWTGTFTPVFGDAARFAAWRQRAGQLWGFS